MRCGSNHGRLWMASASLIPAPSLRSGSIPRVAPPRVRGLSGTPSAATPSRSPRGPAICSVPAEWYIPRTDDRNVVPSPEGLLEDTTRLGVDDHTRGRSGPPGEAVGAVTAPTRRHPSFTLGVNGPDFDLSPTRDGSSGGRPPPDVGSFSAFLGDLPGRPARSTSPYEVHTFSNGQRLFAPQRCKKVCRVKRLTARWRPESGDARPFGRPRSTRLSAGRYLRPCPALVLGPLLRHVSDDDGDDLGGDRRAVHGRGARAPDADVRRAATTTTRW